MPRTPSTTAGLLPRPRRGGIKTQAAWPCATYQLPTTSSRACHSGSPRPCNASPSPAARTLRQGKRLTKEGMVSLMAILAIMASGLLIRRWRHVHSQVRVVRPSQSQWRGGPHRTSSRGRFQMPNTNLRQFLVNDTWSWGSSSAQSLLSLLAQRLHWSETKLKTGNPMTAFVGGFCAANAISTCRAT